MVTRQKKQKQKNVKQNSYVCCEDLKPRGTYMYFEKQIIVRAYCFGFATSFVSQKYAEEL